MPYNDILKRGELKATSQRIAILQIIHKNGHITIDDIYTQTRTTLPNLSLATIYKNILAMISRDILVEVPLAGNKSKYEIKKENHLHLICEKCGNVVDEPLPFIPHNSLMKIVNRDNFILNRTQINLYGICKGCR